MAILPKDDYYTPLKKQQVLPVVNIPKPPAVQNPVEQVTPPTAPPVAQTAQPTAQQTTQAVAQPTPQPSSYEQNRPAYEPKYTGTLENLLNEYLNRGTYDPNAVYASDMYKLAEEAYKNRGQQAMGDTMARAAGLTGGFGSSYATAAGAQAYNQYMNDFAGVAVDMERNAYSRWQNEGNDLISKINTVQNMSDSEYNQFLNELASWQNDRNFNYGREQDALSQSNWQKQFDFSKDQFNYQQQQDALDLLRYYDQQNTQTQAAQQQARQQSIKGIYDRAAAMRKDMKSDKDELSGSRVYSDQQIEESLVQYVMGFAKQYDAEEIADIFRDLGINPNNYKGKYGIN